MISEIIRVVYNYYQLFLLAPIIVMVVIFKSRRLKWRSNIKITTLGWLVVLISLVFVIEISRTYVFYDKLEIWSDGNIQINSVDYGAGIVRLDRNVSRGKVDTNLPYGVNRKVFVTTNDICQVKLQIGNADYEDIYQITGNGQNGLTIYTDTPKLKLLSEILIKMILTAIITNLVFSFMKWVIGFILNMKQTYFRGGGKMGSWSLCICAFSW